MTSLLAYTITIDLFNIPFRDISAFLWWSIVYIIGGLDNRSEGVKIPTKRTDTFFVTNNKTIIQPCQLIKRRTTTMSYHKMSHSQHVYYLNQKWKME